MILRQGWHHPVPYGVPLAATDKSRCSHCWDRLQGATSLGPTSSATHMRTLYDFHVLLVSGMKLAHADARFPNDLHDASPIHVSGIRPFVVRELP